MTKKKKWDKPKDLKLQGNDKRKFAEPSADVIRNRADGKAKKKDHIEKK